MTQHTRQEKIEALGRVIDVLDRLRVECPWDAKQTNETLRPNTVEEVTELVEAILDDDTQNIKKELGDVLLHILFYSKIGEEKGQFDIADVCDALCAKLIYRHPHVFGDTKVNRTDDVLHNWEMLKTKERDGNKTALSGVPKSLSSVIQADRIQEKASNLGFDWEQREQVWDKVKEEVDEFSTEAEKMDQERMTEEMGDLMFALINAARLYKINSDTALQKANRKFTSRFTHMELAAREQGRAISDLTMEEMDALWNAAKEAEKKQ